jgi:membrane-bound serine protease (ClpP class)
MNKLHRWILLLVVVLLVGANFAAAGTKGKIVVIPLKGPISRDLSHSVQREINKANRSNAKAIILEINTEGGYVKSATEICDSINNSKIPVIAYINKRAWSAGALISISSPKIAIASGGSIGAAEPIPKTEKIVSAIKAEFMAWAEKHNRNSDIAAGMVDQNIVIEGLKKQGEILSLTATQALERNFADIKAESLEDILKHEKLDGAEIEYASVEYSWVDSVANLLTSPAARIILLVLGMVCLMIEAFTMDIISGTVGMIAWTLFFFSNIAIGVTPWWVVLVFISGIILMAIEIFVIPGVGVVGVLGMLTTMASMFFAIGDIKQAAISVGFSMVISGAVLAYLMKSLPKSKIWKGLTLESSKTPVEEMITVKQGRLELEGLHGIALTDLRPAGKALINEEKLDVVTDGSFVKKDTPVRVVQVSEMKIVVKEIEGTW